MAWFNTKRVVAIGVGLLLALTVVVLFLYRHEIADHFTIAQANRAIANHTVTIVDLDASYGSRSGIFDNDNSYWGQVPSGFQVFDHVPFQIDGLLYLWGAGNAKAGNIFPEEVHDIPINQKFETLYVYHGAFYSAPNGTPVCEVVFHYEDDSTATNQLLYGSDMLDFVISNSGHPKGPTGARTKRVWTGATFTPGKDQPLQFNVTAIENPYRSLEVKTIDLNSCKNQSAACILAMTTGKSGLMK